MKIMIGVDDSPHSRAAVEWVRRMAWPKESRALVVSAVRPVVAAYAEAYTGTSPYVDPMNEDLVRFHQEIAAGTERELQAAGLETEAKIVHGDPRTALVEVARGERADLLVVGSHGRTGMAKLLMGSVAAHVVAHAPCTVVVVKLSHVTS